MDEDGHHQLPAQHTGPPPFSGRPVLVDELRYWSVARQEAYVDAAASLEAEKRAGALPNQRR